MTLKAYSANSDYLYYLNSIFFYVQSFNKICNNKRKMKVLISIMQYKNGLLTIKKLHTIIINCDKYTDFNLT